MSAHVSDAARLEFRFARADAVVMDGPEAPVGYRVGKGRQWA
jgi:hypothetical protein